MTPGKAGFRALKARGEAPCKQAAGSTPAQRIDTLPPGLRGWATRHRHLIGGETSAALDNAAWQRR